MNFLAWLASVLAVVWWSRRMPVTGLRRFTVLSLRILAVSIVCISLSGMLRRTLQDKPQHVLYLVDRSDSMDARQIEWVSQRIASLDDRRPRGVLRALAVFGGDVEVIFPFSQQPLGEPRAILERLMAVELERDKTNLEAALLAMLRLLPVRQGGHVIVFSDGRETSGDVGRILGHIRRLGLSVFPEPVPVFAASAVAWERLNIPPVVRQGSPVGLELVLSSGARHPKEVLVTVRLAGIPIQRQRAIVNPGWQVIPVSVPAIQQGMLALEVELEIPEDGLRENREVYTEVEGPPHVLLVDDKPTTLPLLASALKRRDIEVSLVRPRDLPTKAQLLLDYDAVLLFGVPKSMITEEQVAALQSYVSSFGGGLIMVGLGGELSHEISTPAPIDSLLPVKFEAKGLQESKRRVCMIMLIDRSASMLGPRIAAAKRAAVELVKQLAPEDLVGVLAFDTKPYIVVEVQPAGQVGLRLIDKLVKLRSSGGTDVYPALTSAKQRFDQTDSIVKHIILLSDGNTPFRQPEYRELAETFVGDNVTVSTIGIGSAFINTKYLQWLSGSTGGTFYKLKDLDELPRLIAKDTQDQLGNLPFTEGYFRPSLSETSELFRDVEDLPALRGYLTTTAKTDALVDLTVRGGEADDPLFVRWSVGQGRAAVFTSDADTRWSPNWVRWPGFDSLWAQAIRWAMRPQLAEEIFVWVDEGRGRPQLIIEGELQDPRVKFIAVEDGSVRALSLVQTGMWRWEASLEQAQSGWYQLALESQYGTSPTFARRWIYVGQPSVSTEAVGQPPHETVLRHLAQSTAGQYGVADLAFLPAIKSAVTHEPLFLLWLPFVVIIFLIEIALRGGTML